MPQIDELSPVTSIRDKMLPSPTFRDYLAAKATYGNISDCIEQMLLRPDFAELAPKAKMAIQVASNGMMDGIDMLNHLYQSRIPVLGANDFSAYAEIMKLKVQDGMQLVDFITQAQDLQYQLALSTHPPHDNSLLQQFLSQLMTTNLQPLISPISTRFNRYNRQHGNRLQYTEDTVESISQDLLDGKVNNTLHLLDTASKPHNVNDPSAFREAMYKHKSKSNFSNLRFAAMDNKKDGTSLVEEDATTEEEIHCTADEIKLAEEMIQPLFEQLSEQGKDNQELRDDLIYRAMTQIVAKRASLCEICNGKHVGGSDGCWARGPQFQPEVIRKQVEQINLRDGNKPKSPPEERVTPPKSSYGKKNLRFKAMSIQSEEQLQSTLDDIVAELEEDITNNDLATEPKMASLTLVDGDATPSRGPAEALQVADYSVYNEQDFY